MFCSDWCGGCGEGYGGYHCCGDEGDGDVVDDDNDDSGVLMMAAVNMGMLVMMMGAD